MTLVMFQHTEPIASMPAIDPLLIELESAVNVERHNELILSSLSLLKNNETALTITRCALLISDTIAGTVTWTPSFAAME